MSGKDKKFIYKGSYIGVSPIVDKLRENRFRWLAWWLTEGGILCMYIVIFLGGIPPGGIRFYKPGPISKTRFTGSALYWLQIAIFSNQFEQRSPQL